MHPMPIRSRLLRFPEGTLINHKYMLISPGKKESGSRSIASIAARNASGTESEPESGEDPPSSYAVPLGWGGSSVVFLARHVIVEPGSGPRSVARAVKFYWLSPTLARRSDRRQLQAANTQNMRNEIKNLTRVPHANVLKVIDAGVWPRDDAAVNYLVTEYVPGPTLGEVIACGSTNQRRTRQAGRGQLVYRQIRQNPLLIVHILVQLCAALQHLHGQNIYHCDIAPKNIFIHHREGCRPILGDFALGRQLDIAGGYDCLPIGGAMRYAPPAHYHFGREVSMREFASYAAYWDMYGFAKSALELVKLAPGSAALPWKSALVRYLREALIEDNGVTASRLRRRLDRLL
jgi:serine/threonine protein kinase